MISVNTRQDSALQLSTTSHSTIMNTASDNTSSPKTKNHPDENRTRQTGPWSKEEDDILLALIKTMGNKHWKAIGEKHGRRDGKQCRERMRSNTRQDSALQLSSSRSATINTANISSKTENHPDDNGTR
ncbi:7857_t:CDS:2 [Ambispora gerdemannii]|uniref:7857_t:CDS:1 n=1 Tax=Ambispora gerdemannii TaxID=144530 RepID=A0A9N9BEN1_9GLOM|nr:7857_t:CDS:2 [Ambispora gerdemannii]